MTRLIYCIPFLAAWMMIAPGKARACSCESDASLQSTSANTSYVVFGHGYRGYRGGLGYRGGWGYRGYLGGYGRYWGGYRGYWGGYRGYWGGYRGYRGYYRGGWRR